MRGRGRPALRRGFTLVELLVAAAIFIVLLGSLTALFVSSSRAYAVTNARSTVIQDEEAVLTLLRYEFALAGYRGLGANPSSAPGDTLAIVNQNGSDAITIRYLEDRYVPGQPEERAVTFSVDPVTRTLLRTEPGTQDQAMVGSVVRLVAVAYIRRDRATVPVVDPWGCGGYCDPPQALAGLLLRVEFVDGAAWEFPVGLYNPQTIGGPG
jgi:prepilin-type N-terminal cleavage/methylation domain-containing protein